jgi:hypothetical protein
MQTRLVLSQVMSSNLSYKTKLQLTISMNHGAYLTVPDIFFLVTTSLATEQKSLNYTQLAAHRNANPMVIQWCRTRLRAKLTLPKF